MRSKTRMRGVLALLTLLAAAVALAACGSDDGTSTEADSTAASGDNLIQENPDNNGVKLTIGSKNFTEQFILGEIYAQALEAAGYNVSTDLNLGSEQVALKALENGDISGYPEYTSTALTSFFNVAPEDVPADAQAAVDEGPVGLEQGPRRAALAQDVEEEPDALLAHGRGQLRVELAEALAVGGPGVEAAELQPG